MLAKSTYIPLLSALALVPILTDCNRGEPEQDDTSQVKFTVPSDNLPAECSSLEPPTEADGGAGTAQDHDAGADASAPDGGAAPVDDGGEGQDGDAGTTTGDAGTTTGPRCQLTITLQPSGGGRAVSGTAGIDQDNPGQMSLSVPSGEYQVTATVTDASDTLLFQLAPSPVTHVFEPGVTVLTVWLNEVLGETTPTEFTPLHIASLMAKDQEPDDDGDEYRVRPNGLIDFTVGVSGTASDATVTVTGRVDTQSGNCGSFGQFVPVESSQNVFTGNWRAGNITDVTCTITITATQVATNGDESNTASISFQVMTYSGEGGGTSRSFVAVLNRGPIITDVGVSPTQINLANSPLQPIEVNVTGTDEESQELAYALTLATSLRRQGADEQNECLLLEPVAGETNGSFTINTPRWGECPELEEATEFVDYVEGPSVVVFDVTVTDEPAPGALTSTPLSAHAKLSLPVMRQGVAN